MTTFTVSQDGIRVLGPNGWHAIDPADVIEVPGGNFLQVNAEGFWQGAVQGFAAGVLVSLFALGVVAAVVVERMQ